MSNGEDVLDNWEEIDEAGLTHTLQKIQAERNKANKIITSAANENICDTSSISRVDIDYSNTKGHTMKLLQRSSSKNSSGFIENVADSFETRELDANKSPLEDMAAALTPVMMLLHKPNEEYQSANYTQPMQAVKILRRPTQQVERQSNDSRPKAPLKTLKQREQEYAEARLRIMGAAKNPEDDKSGKPNASNQVSPGSTVIGVATINNSPASAIKSAPFNQTVTVTQSSPPISQTVQPTVTLPAARTKVTTNLGQKQNILTPETLNFNNHFYPQQQVIQQPNFYHQAQTQYLSSIPTHQLLTISSTFNNSRLSMSGLGTQQTISPNNHSPTIHANICSHTTNRNHYPKHSPHRHQQHSKPPSWSPSRNSMRGQQQDNVLRMPRGPDGSVGFQMRR